MRVRDYLKQLGECVTVTFIKVDIEETEGTKGFYNNVYRTTPIRENHEWLESTSGILDMIVVNKNCPPIDITGTWHKKYEQGLLKCCMVESEETIRTKYSEKQAQDMIEYYERTIK